MALLGRIAAVAGALRRDPGRRAGHAARSGDQADAAGGGGARGAPGGWLLTLAALVSTLGSMSAVVPVNPRIVLAFARHGRLPGALTAIYPRHRSPHIAIIVFVVLGRR